MYSFAENDDWAGELINNQAEKIHSSHKEELAALTLIITSPYTRREEKEWATDQMEKLLN